MDHWIQNLCLTFSIIVIYCYFSETIWLNYLSIGNSSSFFAFLDEIAESPNMDQTITPFSFFFGLNTFSHLVIYWLISGLFIFVEGNCVLHQKIQESHPRHKHLHRNVHNLWQCIKWVLFNQLVVGFIVSYFSYHLVVLNWSQTPYLQPLPPLYTLVKQLGYCALITETLFYFLHRLFHYIPFLYGYIHKQHHYYTSPNAISSIYCHPVEHAIVNLLPVLAGPLIMRSHFIVMTLWFAISTINTQFAHCGYHVPWMPSPRIHDAHHQYFNVNYGAIGLWDHLLGTAG